ncbi:MAG: 6-pyruvoyl tetrahydropterin synthase [Alphaproteobacteria bacterium]|nr:6-pyruvoyl tetrahydropterin synthase [Alphaproteobacteria bacterium]
MAALEFSRRYAMAHRLLADPQSKCAVPHGHNEIVSVRLEPHARFRFGGANAVAPFDAVKRRWHAWIDDHVDHALMLNAADPLIEYFRAQETARLARIMTFPGDPTTEALAACFFLKLSAFLAADALPFSVAAVRVEETPTNAVCVGRESFDADDPLIAPGAWPRRADMSLNDFNAALSAGGKSP